jgi:hypothetical protein
MLKVHCTHIYHRLIPQRGYRDTCLKKMQGFGTQPPKLVHECVQPVTQRAKVEENGTMEVLTVNLGFKATMKYPSTYLWGLGAWRDTFR